MEELETERLRLRQVQVGEAEALMRGEQPEGLIFAEGYPSEFSLEAMDLLAGARKVEAPGFTPWFLIRRDDGTVIGEAGFSITEGEARPSIGYSIVEPLWGRGYASEAVRALIPYLFSLDQVEAVQADTFPEHIASRRVMEKAGMHFSGEKQDDEDGQTVTLVVYELTRETYEAL